ncbi:UDP-glucose/GDP-mannose dehydrogenase family protein [Candidatus Saccharibacteria bacterium]|nr:UDP-glucose/GDP-mannose dehydrogenase family protein [Candidatus Saccharibacteria bacterium]
MKSSPQVTVIGAGYVGLVTATLLAEAGIKTHILDLASPKIKTIKRGRAPFFEPGLDELVAKTIKNNRLLATTSYRQAVPSSEIIFCCVGTPDKKDGSSNLGYVHKALRTAAGLAADGVVFVQKSTVPAGTGQSLIKTINKMAPGLQFSYVSNPEFLREGSAITDSRHPDRVVLGGDSPAAIRRVAGLYRLITKPGAKYLQTSLESAELIKVTANAFLALKISFANSIAKLAGQTGADIKSVMDGVGLDKRIGRAFLNAGRGYGGGCFPKDVAGLIAAAAQSGADMTIMESVVKVNNSMPNYVVKRLSDQLGAKTGQLVAVLGLSFKAGTSDSRRSPAVAISNLLADCGYRVTTYDPKAVIANRQLKTAVKRLPNLPAALKGVAAVVVATDWPEFVNLDWSNVKGQMAGDLVLDAMNCLDDAAVTKAGLRYTGIGR